MGFVKLFMRSDCCTSRADQFEIRLGNTVGELANEVCHSANQDANTATFFNWAQCKGRGRYLYVVWYPTDTQVDICEVEIFPPYTVQDIAGPFRHYRASDWDGGGEKLVDTSGNRADSVSSSGVSKGTAEGNGARGAVDYVFGDRLSHLSWTAGDDSAFVHHLLGDAAYKRIRVAEPDSAGLPGELASRPHECRASRWSFLWRSVDTADERGVG